MMRILTGVSGHISAAHQGPEGGMHGHTWTVRAWWPEQADARGIKAALDAQLALYCHTVLPAELARGENLAWQLGESLDGCIAVEVSREAEGFFARWEA